MKNPDDAIEKVLAGLRNAEAAPGMEERLLRAVQGQVAAHSQANWGRWRPVWLKLPAHAASWSLACGLLAVVAILQWHPGIRQRAAMPAGLKRASPSVTPFAPLTAGIAKVEQPPSSEPRPRSSTKRDVRSAVPSYRHDAPAMREMQSASFPAPPMPLTEQEKLLLRMAHKGDPVELATLIPELRDKQIAEGKAQFQSFFEQAATGDNK